MVCTYLFQWRARTCILWRARTCDLWRARTPSRAERPVTFPDFISLSLEYACLQWIYHVADVHDPSILEDFINDVFRPRILFWLEVMSVLGRVRRAAAMLMFAAATVCSADSLGQNK